VLCLTTSRATRSGTPDGGTPNRCGNVAAAAERLGVHPNTLRYRLRRAVELSGLDLGDADERLVTELQLRLPG
jgi:DNA-binding PucR family transcriptional regulator